MYDHTHLCTTASLTLNDQSEAAIKTRAISNKIWSVIFTVIYLDFFQEECDLSV